MPRILFLGENWYGSSARACCYALRRLGCDVRDVDIQTFLPQVRQRASKAALRLLRGMMVREYNQRILEIASLFQPDVLLAFKAAYIKPATLRQLRQQGVALYNYYPDTSAFAHGRLLPKSLPEYDCVFYTKPFWADDVWKKNLILRQAIFLPHGYDPEIHRVHEIGPQDSRRFDADLMVVATYNRAKENLLQQLVGKRPELKLVIWGNRWEKCRSTRLRPFIRGMALEGSDYAKAIRVARINLGLLSGRVSGASQGDETTTRTYEVPACGGFMLHERTPEVLRLYQEGKEMAAYGSVEELAQKIDYYLAHPGERQAIAQAGHERCVPAYSYDNRMREILRWHKQVKGPA
jgi:hypothetical protein